MQCGTELTIDSTLVILTGRGSYIYIWELFSQIIFFCCNGLGVTVREKDTGSRVIVVFSPYTILKSKLFPKLCLLCML